MTVAEQLFIACLKRKDSKILSLVQKRWLDGSEVVQHRVIVDYFKDEGELLGVKTFCERFKLSEGSVDARPSYYLNKLKERFIFSSLADKVPGIIRNLKEDPRKKLEELQDLVSSLSVDSVESKDTLYSDDVELRRQDYLERTKSLGVTYLSMGNDAMDSSFYGYRKNDLITVGGIAGQGKTWFLTYLAVLLEDVLKIRAELGDTFGDILFLTNEMGEEEIKERIDCIRFRLPYENFMKGKLTEREQGRYFRGLENLKKGKSRIRIVDTCQTIDELSILIGLHKPSAVFIDGSYLMEGKIQEGWEKIVYITRNLKRLAKGTKTPIINTTQLKRGSGKKSGGDESFAYSGSYSQDSDIALQMYQDADMKFHDLVGLEVVKGRRVRSGTTLMFQNDLTRSLHSITLPVEEDVRSEIKDDL